MAAAYLGARAMVSDQGRQELHSSQSSWLRYWPMVCFEGRDMFGRSKPDSTDPVACAKAEYDARIEQLENAVQPFGDKVFLKTQLYTVGELGGINYSVMPVLSLDKPSGSHANLFNRQVTHWVRALDLVSEAGLDVSAECGLDIYLQQEAFVGLQADTYRYNRGAAHGGTATKYLNYDLEAATVVDGDRLFDQASGWQPFLVARSKEVLTQKLGADGFWPNNLTPSAVSDPTQWKLTDQTFVLSFPLYSVASYAAGVQEVEIPWSDLSPYLAETAPDFAHQ